MKTIVLCLGNAILSDDGVGIHVADRLRAVIDSLDVSVTEAGIGGIRLLDLLQGYDRAIIIDAIRLRKQKPGYIYRFDQANLQETTHSYSAHDIGLMTALELGRTLGISIPPRITVFAIEAEDVSTFSETCTPAVARAVDRCVALVLDELESGGRAQRSN